MECCCICLDTPVTRSTVVLGCCKAQLHRQCLTKYVLQESDRTPRCMLCRAPLSPVLVREIEVHAPPWLVRDTLGCMLAAVVVREANRVAQELLDLVAAEQEFQAEMESIDVEYGL